MIMDLPENITELKQGKTILGKIENGTLKIYNTTAFRRIVYDLTFELKGGKHYCYYCKKKIVNNKATMDHIYPQAQGGPTITNNLVPSCSTCNSEKTNMTIEEYNKYLSYSSNKKQRPEYEKLLKSKKEEIRKQKQYDIPKEWLSKREISKIYIEVRLSDPSKSLKYKKVERFYDLYGYFQKPIIIDKNGFLLDGYYNVAYAKGHGITTLSVIKLENVEVVFQ